MNKKETTKLDEKITWFKNHPWIYIVLLLGIITISIGTVSKSILNIEDLVDHIQLFFNNPNKNKPPSEWSKQAELFGNFLQENILYFPRSETVVIEQDITIDFYQNLNLQDDTQLDELRNSIVVQLKKLVPIYHGNKKFHMLPESLRKEMRTLYVGVKKHAQDDP